jgi:hypothetical protein
MSSPEAGGSEPRVRAALGADLIIPVVACGLTGYYLASTTDLVWEARATGTVIGLVLLALCAVLFVKLGMSVASGRATLGFGDLFKINEFNRQRLGLIVLMTTYIVTIYWVGATVGLFFLLIGCMWVLGVRSITTLVGVALTASVLTHLALITLLDSKLPRGLLFGQSGPMATEEPAKEPAKPGKKR